MDMRRLLSIQGKPGDAPSLLWATREALQCADVQSVLAWLPDARSAHVRRLQIAAHAHHKLLFVFRPLRAQHESSPAPLRLLVEGAVARRAMLRVTCSSGAARRWPRRCCSTPGRPGWRRCWRPAAKGRGASAKRPVCWRPCCCRRGCRFLLRLPRVPSMRCWIALRISTTTEAGSAPSVLDAAALQRAVASLALGLTPRVALVDEAVLMDVTGSLRLFGGLARLMQLLAERLAVFFEENGQQAEIRRAQGATSLIALGRLRLLEEGGATVKKRVADLPMHTLTAARPHLGVLERIGCRSWDDLLRLPRDGVARRFGAELLEALDRARGSAADDYVWLVLPEHFEEKLELNALVTHAPALMAGVERLLAHLHAWLLGRQSGLCALKITWHLDKRRDVPPTGELEVRTAQPAQDLRHVARLISEHLAQQKLPAPVHSLTCSRWPPNCWPIRPRPPAAC
jgi:hypothetical protein